MTDMMEWTYRRVEGAPEEAHAGTGTMRQLLGFDKDGGAYIMRWSKIANCFVAVGVERHPEWPENVRQVEPVVHLIREENANLIVAWASLPAEAWEFDTP